MIIDLNLKGGLVIVVGGGNEGLKKINALLTQDCKILLFSDFTNKQIRKYVKAKKIQFKRIALKNAKFLEQHNPVMVLATTDNKELNRKIVEKAKKIRCYAYAADDPEVSDFAFGSVINIQDTIQIAISTKGRSPAMERKIRLKAQRVFRKLIKKEDVFQIKLQEYARNEARHRLDTFPQRKAFLYKVMNDKTICRHSKSGNLKKAQLRVVDMLNVVAQ
ncbi:MAG: bifunctional precorrin-2 dehydrogenase/sirohydrochlorin ferrochelatase [Thaumarchaeota archaeon]|nr:bifunctional precorrin-2 dehydrogenase/sirohydrochlorin ferrochelatase [Nitrososphaerota archaeon]